MPTALRSLADHTVYLAIRAALAGVGSIPRGPSESVARSLARAYARLPSSRKRVARAVRNLAVAFPDWDRDRIDAYARGAYEHLFALGTEMAQGPHLLTEDGWHRHVALGDISSGLRALLSAGPCLLITGHCGNWEMLGYTVAFLGFPMHALYRPLDLKPLDHWVRRTRERRGLTLMDKFGALRRLPPMVGAGIPIGFVADQNGGDRGVFVPFFNRLTSTYKSIGLLALQFRTRILCAMARRLPPEEREPGSFGYRVEVSDVFGPQDWACHPDPLFYLTARYRRAIERMVRAVPDQYLWMHRIWRSRPRHERHQRPFPAALAEKIRLLPWITDADLDAIKAHSIRDARTLAETGQDKLS